MSGFDAQIDAINTHGKLLSTQLAADLQEAVSASQVSLGAEAMGVICQVWSFIFNDELDHAKDLVGKLPGVMESTGDGLSATAETYRRTEDDNSVTFGGMIQ